MISDMTLIQPVSDLVWQGVYVLLITFFIIGLSAVITLLFRRVDRVN